MIDSSIVRTTCHIPVLGSGPFVLFPEAVKSLQTRNVVPGPAAAVIVAATPATCSPDPGSAVPLLTESPAVESCPGVGRSSPVPGPAVVGTESGDILACS